jgi:rod shape-determining protein MreC
MLRLAMPFKAAVQRFAFFLLVGASAALLVLGKADVALIQKVRIVVADAATPILDVVAEPVSALNRAIDEVESLISLREENARLREENRRLLQWQVVARRLEQENNLFRSQLHFQQESEIEIVSARVIGDSGGPFVRTMLLNAGHDAGVALGQAVVTGDGLVGRVAQVGKQSARILLITDLNSRIPVVIEGGRHRAVMAGDNSRRPKLEFLPVSAQVSAGDRVVTSGHGGLCPPGLPIGVVAELKDGVPRVQAFADWDRIEVVRVLLYNVPKLEPGQEDAEMVRSQQ